MDPTVFLLLVPRPSPPALRIRLLGNFLHFQSPGTFALCLGLTPAPTDWGFGSLRAGPSASLFDAAPITAQDHSLGADTQEENLPWPPLSPAIPSPPPALFPSFLPSSQGGKLSASIPSPWSHHGPGGRGPAGLSMPFYWEDCCAHSSPGGKGIQGHNMGTAPPCPLTSLHHLTPFSGYLDMCLFLAFQ